jgi:Arc/MetJ family transcription regulator
LNPRLFAGNQEFNWSVRSVAAIRSSAGNWIASQSDSIDAIFDANSIQEPGMRTTVTIDEALLSRAQLLSGVKERSALLKEALSALIQRESARRLAALGGSEPRLKNVARRREGKR